MNAVLWVLALPSLALGGLAFRLLPDWFDGQDLTPTLTTSVLGTGVALVGGIVTYAAWRHTTALADRTPLGAVAAHPEGDAGLVEAEAIAAHRAAYGDLASAPDPSDPGRLLLGPVHRHAAAASTWTRCTRPSSSAPSRRARASSGSSTARSSTPTYARRAPCPACSGPPYDVPRPAMCRPM